MIKAALFDVDGTLVDGRVWRGIVAHPNASRSRVRWHFIRLWPLFGLSKLLPDIEAYFRDRWVHGLAAIVHGWSSDEIRAMSDWIANEFLQPIYRDDVIQRLVDHKAAGHHIVLVSTMFPEISQAVADRIGADAALGSLLAYDANGIVTGRIDGESCAGSRKSDFAARYLAQVEGGITLEECAIYSDSYSDFPFLLSAGQPFAVYPDDTLYGEAVARQWTVIGRD